MALNLVGSRKYLGILVISKKETTTQPSSFQSIIKKFINAMIKIIVFIVYKIMVLYLDIMAAIYVYIRHLVKKGKNQEFGFRDHITRKRHQLRQV